MERMQQAAVVNNLLDSRAENKSLSALVHYLNSILYTNLENSDSLVSGLIDPEFMKEIVNINSQRDKLLYFGKSLRYLKCVLLSKGSLREIDVFIQYKGPKKLCVTDANLPQTALQDKEYSSLKDIITIYEKYIDSLSGYFHELERIDRFCTVMEPAKPTFRDDFRRVLLDDRTWLHVRVTPKGFATDIHLVGNAEQWNEKLQVGLLNWDHDMDIVENITAVFDIWNYSIQPKSPDESPSLEKAHGVSETVVCNICYCAELLDAPNVPQPLCLNARCLAYFHRSCLFQWLLACSGGRPPAFGVATGSCPVCYEPTSCSEKDT